MRMPSGSGAGLEGHASALHEGRIRGLEERIDPYTAGEPLCRSLSGRLRANSFDFHFCTPSPSLRAEQGLDGPSFVHRAVSFSNLIKRQYQIEYYAGMDLLVQQQIDQFGKITANRRWAAVQVYVSEESSLHV